MPSKLVTLLHSYKRDERSSAPTKLDIASMNIVRVQQGLAAAAEVLSCNPEVEKQLGANLEGLYENYKKNEKVLFQVTHDAIERDPTLFQSLDRPLIGIASVNFSIIADTYSKNKTKKLQKKS